MAMKINRNTFKWSAWLGWQMESNWTQPGIFAIYALVRPIAASLILVSMVYIITFLDDPTVARTHLAFIFIGSTFFMYVSQVLWSVTWVIHDDREHFRTLKYIYISPANYFVYILGRTLSTIMITSFAVVITLTFGILILEIPINLLEINWFLFIPVLIIGLLSIIAFGLALTGISFLTAKHTMGMNEGVAGLFYLFCGVLFQIHFLPDWGISFAKIIPVTYWLHLIRVSLGAGADIDTAMTGTSAEAGVVILIVSTICFAIFSIGTFRLGDYLARKKGYLDMTTAY
jgi:ABC-2 type transport system permease protein